MAKSKYTKTIVPLSKEKVTVYAGARFKSAVDAIMQLDAFSGLKVIDLLDTMYTQGKKDGAREVADEFGKMMKQIPHQNPGRPKKKK